ncbi:MAG TPA: ATP-dependent zinc metalloprotease FtsH [Planctomycetota bacterium]|nr:ATP-dependent zinc metalloprotease FtsH [Planctomycetota bacterium]
MPAESPTPPPKPRNLFVIMMAIFGVLILSILMVQKMSHPPQGWGWMLEQIDKGKVAKIKRGPEAAEVTLNKEGGGVTYRIDYPNGRLLEPDVLALNQRVDDHNARVKRATAEATGPVSPEIEVVGSPAPGFISSLLPQIVVFAIILAALYFFIFRRMSQGGGVLSFGKSRAVLVTKGKTSKSFKDVAGIDEAKEEVEELVAFLRNPKKFQKLGGRIPKGVMLVGPPGTGKTLLAKAIAGEADVPFYSISGSDFVEMFVGVGASRVRDLFNQAKENSPCIIFIDEIDAVGRRRGSGMSSGGHDEREQTLNAILVEMDGFTSHDKVIVIAATNRVDVLDPALLRPGRFDRHIYVDLPDIAGREQILGVHVQKIKIDPTVDLSIIARGTPGFSGADLESLINEAALNAARSEQEMVIAKDLEYARDRVAFGREKKAGSRAMPENERLVTAYHEAGHTILQVLVDESDDLHKVTIIPRGRALGATMHLPNQDRHTHAKRKILSDICILFGGRIAEETFCGDVTTGASNDIQRATSLARGMVYEWGMSDKMGPLKYTEEHDGMMGTESVVTASTQTRRELDEEVRAIIDAQYARARDIILTNRDKVERVAKALLEHETLDAQQVHLLLDGGELPPRRPTVTILKQPDAKSKPDKGEPEAGLGGQLKPQLA